MRISIDPQRLLEGLLHAWLIGSGLLLIRWAWRTRLGRGELAVRPLRQNFLQLPTLGLVFLGYIFVQLALLAVLGALHPAGAEAGPAAHWLIGVSIASQAALAALALPIAAWAFAGGLAGFGLRFADAGRSILAGAGYLAVIFPPVVLTLKVSEAAFERLGWPIREHPLLQTIRAEPTAGLIAVAVVAAVLAAPLAEELFFRGLVQSFLVRFFRVMMPPKGWPTMALWIRPPELVRAEAEAALTRARARGEQAPPDPDVPPSAAEAGGQSEPLSPGQEFRRAVAAIVLAALVFASAHFSVPVSVPAIFVLALALGYAYEKTGSLLTVITMHVGFNAANVALFLLQPGAR